MPWGWVLAATGIYQADQQRRAARDARQLARKTAAETLDVQERQLAIQREQADTARERLDYEITKSKEDRAKLDADAKKIADELEAEQRKLSERESSRLSALRRGGRRSLLSQERLNPELGLTAYEDILGTGVNI